MGEEIKTLKTSMERIEMELGQKVAILEKKLGEKSV